MNPIQGNQSPTELNGVNPSSISSQNQIDELSFGLLMNRTLGGSGNRRPSDKSANELQVDMFLGQAQNLAKMKEQYEDTYVTRGTKELYALLGAIYSYTLQINESPLRDYILQSMREKLEEDHDIKTQINTPWITTVLRFILPLDRQTAYSYSRVLQVAHDENKSAQELPDYIKERGGIGKITSTKEEVAAALVLKKHKEAKTAMLRKILMTNAKSSQNIVDVDDKLVLNAIGEGKKEGEFEFAICVNTLGKERRIVRFIRMNKTVEASILAMVAEAIMPDDLEATQNKLDELRQKLGITSGWGMKPGDKGFQPGGLPPVLSATTSTVQPEAMLNAPLNSQIQGHSIHSPA
jgi:hypothetical protein